LSQVNGNLAMRLLPNLHCSADSRRPDRRYKN